MCIINFKFRLTTNVRVHFYCVVLQISYHRCLVTIFPFFSSIGTTYSYCLLPCLRLVAYDVFWFPILALLQIYESIRDVLLHSQQTFLLNFGLISLYYTEIGCIAEQAVIQQICLFGCFRLDVAWNSRCLWVCMFFFCARVRYSIRVQLDTLG